MQHHELLDMLPARVAAVESRVDKLVASCRECREERLEHNKRIIKAIDGYRDTFREHIGELEARLNTKLDDIVKSLKCSKPKSRRTCQ
jgi:uncharacterized coiled-coil DUF342 family protein